FTEGDFTRPTSTGSATCLNPRPPYSRRATPREPCPRAPGPGFNPRPPYSRRATTGQAWTIQRARVFQHTPPIVTEGDSWSRQRVGVNPRPPYSRRATGVCPTPPSAWTCFNPRPPYSRRATLG